MKHENNGNCAKCRSIFAKYPGFYKPLEDWFFNDVQAHHPEAHISEAGRGEELQEIMFIRRVSKAHYGESGHNYNAAIDIFENGGNPKDIYETKWYKDVLAKKIPKWLVWYGEPGSKFYELPHVEVRDWKTLVKNGTLKLVEPKKNVA